ncbi:RNA-binding S4 domain-containing protein [Aurantimonas sp. Leaf443]|uniref:RNA-binding S4 domain-containing protein n=1 Tax=Aurantimonas sp. Leaf443 TaxID=1736378 RepID=UPI0009E76AD6|nr:RNA-binding S4 domain-containing protein [Aurantimonas sp. Leaf443]
MSESGQRIDKWLFFARVVKSRSLAQKLVTAGAARINRDKTDNPARAVRPGDVLTITLRGGVRILKVLAPGERRGPAPEAALLYEDLRPPLVPSEGEEDGEGEGSAGESEAGSPARTESGAKAPKDGRPDLRGSGRRAAPGVSPGRAPNKRERRDISRSKRGED